MKKVLCSIIAASMIFSAAAITPASAALVSSSFVASGQNQVETPQITKIENTAEGVKIYWNKVAGAYKYRVYYKGSKGWTRFAETTSTTAIDSVVASGVTYTYTVRCLDENGDFISDYNKVGWKHKFISVPPQITKIENTDKGVKLSWGKVAGAYKYRVYYKGSKGWTRFAETTGTTAVDYDVFSGETYTYTVRALDKNGIFVSSYNPDGWKQTYINPNPTWHEAVYKDVYHPAETKQVWVIDKAAYEKEEVVYKEVGFNVCNTCNKVFDYEWEVHRACEGHSYEFGASKCGLKKIGEGSAEELASNDLAYVKPGYTPAELIKPYAVYSVGDRWSRDVVFKKTDVDLTKLTTGPDSPYVYFRTMDSGYHWGVYTYICGDCGKEIIADMPAHLSQYCAGSYRLVHKTVPVGTQTVTVPEEGHWETRTTKEAWTERVIVREAGWY